MRTFCMECSRWFADGDVNHVCVGYLGWKVVTLCLIWRLAKAQGGAMWN